jgi:hypothetical protein
MEMSTVFDGKELRAMYDKLDTFNIADYRSISICNAIRPQEKRGFGMCRLYFKTNQEIGTPEYYCRKHIIKLNAF